MYNNSVIRLKDGRIGTIVHLYAASEDLYCVELEDTGDLVDVKSEMIDSVLWTPPVHAQGGDKEVERFDC